MISDLKQKQRKKNLKLNSALIFIDLKRAYDNVNRSKHLILLQKASIPGTIIEVIKTMFMKSRITFDGHATCYTSRGLLQGSCLSPILFKFYINSLLRNLEINNTWFKAYDDYIVIAVNDIKEKKETPVFPPGIAALRRRNPGEKLVAGSIPLKGHF